MTAALTISNLCKTYGNGVVALKGIDLAVEQGDFFALLGRNGAGKIDRHRHHLLAGEQKRRHGEDL